MPQFKATNRTLFDYNEQKKQLRNTLVGKLLNGKMNEFESRHAEKSLTLEKRLSYLNKQYFLFKGEKMQMQPMYEQRPNKFCGVTISISKIKTDKQEPILMPGKTMADYEKEFAQLMNQEVVLEF